MKFWRNPEIKRQLLFYCILSAVLLLLSSLFAGAVTQVRGLSWQIRENIWRLALLGTGLPLFLAGLFHFAVTFWRYRRLAALAGQVDRFLHDPACLDFQRQEEGELAILEDEIWKMTVMLRGQADALKEERQYLCDAITDLSHQLRTPLTSLNLIQAMLSEPALSRERRQELFRSQEALLRRIDSLLAVLLKMARIDAGAVSFRREQVKLRRLAQQAAEPLAVPAELRGQQIVFHGDDEAAFLGDLSWSAEAAANILKNCVEHTQRGGQIDVSWQENAVYAELCIEDNGPGIAPEDLPHILKRFYKGKNQGEESFGVGLAFARMIVTAQNGVLTAENRSQGGARFVMRFYKTVV